MSSSILWSFFGSLAASKAAIFSACLAIHHEDSRTWAEIEGWALSVRAGDFWSAETTEKAIVTPITREEMDFILSEIYQPNQLVQES